MANMEPAPRCDLTKIKRRKKIDPPAAPYGKNRRPKAPSQGACANFLKPVRVCAALFRVRRYARRGIIQTMQRAQSGISSSGDPENPGDASLRVKRPRIAGLIISAVALAGIVAFILHVGDIGKFAQSALQTDIRWLALALIAQALAFFVQALVWALVLARRNRAVRRRDLFALSIGKLFADQAVPSAGVSGAAFLVHALTRRGVPAADAFTAFVFGGASSILAFLIFAAGALGFLALQGGPVDEFAVNITDMHYIAIASILLLVAIGAVIAASQSKGKLNPGAFAKMRDTVMTAVKLIYVERGLFAACLGLQSIIRILDCVTLWISFEALGGGVSFLTSVVAVSLASLAATVAPTPMGLGSFEAGLLAALAAFGHSIEASLTGGLIYRGLSLGLPLALGFFVVQRELLKR